MIVSFPYVPAVIVRRKSQQTTNHVKKQTHRSPCNQVNCFTSAIGPSFLESQRHRRPQRQGTRIQEQHATAQTIVVQVTDWYIYYHARKARISSERLGRCEFSSATAGTTASAHRTQGTSATTLPVISIEQSVGSYNRMLANRSWECGILFRQASGK